LKVFRDEHLLDKLHNRSIIIGAPINLDRFIYINNQWSPASEALAITSNGTRTPQDYTTEYVRCIGQIGRQACSRTANGHVPRTYTAVGPKPNNCRTTYSKGVLRVDRDTSYLTHCNEAHTLTRSNLQLYQAYITVNYVMSRYSRQAGRQYYLARIVTNIILEITLWGTVDIRNNQK